MWEVQLLFEAHARVYSARRGGAQGVLSVILVRVKTRRLYYATSPTLYKNLRTVLPPSSATKISWDFMFGEAAAVALRADYNCQPHIVQSGTH